jgi:hypothetical protein
MPTPGVPIAELTKSELLMRYEWALKACWLNGQTLRIPSDIRAVFDECRTEIEGRVLSAEANLPSMLCADDPAAINHETPIVRYFHRREHLEQFLGGSISLAPASEYRTQIDPARSDDEHVRPYACANQSVTFSDGLSYPLTEIRMRRNIGYPDGTLFPYHVLSFSSEQSRKLSRDFQSNGAVLIRNIQLFFDLICDKLRIEQPKAIVHLRNVDYYDPFAVNPSAGGSIDILWRKPFQFLYQREVRVVVLNGSPENGRINIHIPASNLFELIET